jgi:Taurine catabolism dioxygenase TauD, TfdA family
MPQNSGGEILSHVRAARRAAAPGEGIRGHRSSSALPFHSDSCDIVGLLCISDAEAGGLSAIASSYAIHNAMLTEYPEALQLLYQPFHIDRHGEETQGGLRYYSTPVFMWHHDRLFSRFNPGYVYSAQRYPEAPRLTVQQRDTMQIFHRLCASDQFRYNMKFRPGDLQLLNNNFTVHARSSYQDCPEAGKRRHLLRVWLFTSGMDGVPEQMRDRYRDMEAWRVNLRLPKQPG